MNRRFQVGGDKMYLSQFDPNQIREILDEEDFYSNYNFGEFYLCQGDELIYIDTEYDSCILSRIQNGEKVVSIYEEGEKGIR